MKLGFVSAILPELSLEEVFDFAKESGYDCVEVMCWPMGKAERRYAGVTHLDVTALGLKDADDVHKLVQKTGIQISALGYYPNALSPDPEEAGVAIAHINKVIEAANYLGIANVNTFIGRDWTKSVDDNWGNFLSVWEPIIQLAELKSVYVGIENCPMLFTKDEWPGGKNLKTTPAIWRRMYKDIDSAHFGLNFDPSHFVWQRMDYLTVLEEFASKLFHIHAKDATLDLERLNNVGALAYPNDYHTPKIPGRGDVDWKLFFDKLHEVGYDGAVCVEVEDREFESTLELRKESLRQSISHLKNL